MVPVKSLLVVHEDHATPLAYRNDWLTGTIRLLSDSLYHRGKIVPSGGVGMSNDNSTIGTISAIRAATAVGTIGIIDTVAAESHRLRKSFAANGSVSQF